MTADSRRRAWTRPIKMAALACDRILIWCLEHEAPMPDVPDPEALPDFATRMAPYAEQLGGWFHRPRPIDTTGLDEPHPAPRPDKQERERDIVPAGRDQR